METYRALCTEYYDLDKPDAPKESLAFFLEYAQGKILEPMSGSGRFLIPFLEMGFDIEGLDASPHMIAACMERCHAKKIAPVIYKQSLTEMRTGKLYNYIFIPTGSFGLLLDIDSIEEGLKRIHDHLAPKGKFIFDIETLQGSPENLGIWGGDFKQRKDGSKLSISKLSSFDKKSQLLTTLCRYDSIRDCKIEYTEVEDFKVRLYLENELDPLLKKSGFSILGKYADYFKTPWKKGSVETIYVCQRN